MKDLVRKNEMSLKEWLRELPLTWSNEWSWLDDEGGYEITITHTDNKFYCDYKMRAEDGNYQLKWSFSTYDVNYFDWFIESNVIYMEEE